VSGGNAVEDWYERTEEVQPSGKVYIRLTCRDCPGEVRLLKSPAGEERAARMIAEHKPSGCCDERQAKAS
jgi:hypothetical protein